MIISFCLNIVLSIVCLFFSYKFFQLSKNFKKLSEDYHNLVENIEALKKVIY